MFQRFFSARPKPSNPGSWSNIWTSSMKTTKIQAGHDWNLWMGWKLTSSCRYTSIAARGGGGSFKREKIYNSEEQVPIEFVRVTCFNNAHFEEFFSTCADRRSMQCECLSLLASQSQKHSHCASVMGMPKMFKWKMSQAYNSAPQSKQSAKTYDDCSGRHLLMSELL